MAFGAMVAPLAGATYGGGASAASGAAGAGMLGTIGAGLGALSDAVGIGSALFGDQGADMPRSFYNAQLYQPIRIRVQDAQAAGIHPLFALGYQGSIGGPIPSGQSSTGSLVSDAVGRAAQRVDRMAASERARTLEDMQLAIGASQIRKNDADAVASLAEASRIRMAANRISNDEAAVLPSEYGPFKDEIPTVTRARPNDPSTLSGPPRPGYIEVMLQNGETISVPDPNIVESELPGFELWVRDKWRRYQQWGRESQNPAPFIGRKLGGFVHWLTENFPYMRKY